MIIIIKYIEKGGKREEQMEWTGEKGIGKGKREGGGRGMDWRGGKRGGKNEKILKINKRINK